MFLSFKESFSLSSIAFTHAVYAPESNRPMHERFFLFLVTPEKQTVRELKHVGETRYYACANSESIPHRATGFKMSSLASDIDLTSPITICRDNTPGEYSIIIPIKCGGSITSISQPKHIDFHLPVGHAHCEILLSASQPPPTLAPRRSYCEDGVGVVFQDY